MVSLYFVIAVCIFSLNPKHYWRKLDLLILLTDLGPKLMATCNNSEDDVFLMFELNVTVCAAVFKPVCFVKAGLDGVGGPGLSVGTRHCNAKMFFSFLTLGAPQHLHLSFDFRAISGGVVCNRRPGPDRCSPQLVCL